MTPQERVRAVFARYENAKTYDEKCHAWDELSRTIFNAAPLLADALDAAEAKLEAARVALEKAPHSLDCASITNCFFNERDKTIVPTKPCDCWKSKLLATEGFENGLTVEHILLSVTIVSTKESAGQFDDSCAHAVQKTLKEYHGVKSVEAQVLYEHTKIEKHADHCKCGHCEPPSLSPQP